MLLSTDNADHADFQIISKWCYIIALTSNKDDAGALISTSHFPGVNAK